MSIPAEVSDGTGGDCADLHGGAESRVDDAGARSDGGGASGRTGQDRVGVPGRQAQRCGWPRAWGAPEYGWSVAQALRGGGTGWAARSGAAGQGAKIWRGSAPAGSAPTGIAAAQGVGRLGWRRCGRGAGRLGRCGVAPAASGRRAIAPAPLVVRQHRPAICRQGRRYYRPLPEPAGKRAGPERRREADDPGAGARQWICPDQAAARLFTA